MSKLFQSLLALLLCFALLTPSAALAEEAEPSILDDAAIQAMLDEYIASHDINPENISVGYVYTATGDTWFYNADKWYYSASMYKVPLMMILAEKEHKGELTRDSEVKGLKLGYAEEVILTYSHNDYAHLMMSALAPTEPDCRDLYKQYAQLPDDYYVSDFRDYSYFTARFMTQVMTTLFTEPERFPNVIDCLLNAQPEDYYNLTLGQYDIAQKYGSYRDNSWRDWNHTAAIIYLPNPIILTVMTLDNPTAELTIAEVGKLFADYSLGLDSKLEQYRAEQEAARLAAEEEARRQAEEEERRLAEAAEEPDTATVLDAAEAMNPAAETPLPAAAPSAAANEENTALRLYVLIGAAGLGALCLLVYLLRRKRR